MARMPFCDTCKCWTTSEENPCPKCQDKIIEEVIENENVAS